MISFNKDYSLDEKISLSAKYFGELMESLSETDPYYSGSYHGGLHPDGITEIIKHLMFKEGNESLQIIIDKEADGYHLSVTIDEKE